MTYDRAVVTSTVEYLQERADALDGTTPNWMIRAFADQIGCNPRSLRRWMKSGVSQKRLPAKLDDQGIQAVADAQGQRRAAWKWSSAEGTFDRSYRTFTRRFNNVDPIIRGAVTKGMSEAYRSGLYNVVEARARLEVVQFDHFMSDVFVTLPRSPRLIRPWVTLLEDTKTRMNLAAVVTAGDGIGGDPGTESVVAGITEAIRGETAYDGTFVGGLPVVFQFDNALAHIAEPVLAGYLAFGCGSRAIHPHSPWEDGKVERLVQTFHNELERECVGYVYALRDSSGRADWAPDECMTLTQYAEKIAGFRRFYNYERVHSVLGCTPFESWRADPTPIRQVPDDLLRRSFLKEKKLHKVNKSGIHFRNGWYLHPILGHHPDHGSLVGRWVSLRYLEHDDTFVDVYLEGDFVCTAFHSTELTRNERGRISIERSRMNAKADTIIKRSHRRQRQFELDANPFRQPEASPGAPPVPEEDSEDFVDAYERRSRAPLSDTDRPMDAGREDVGGAPDEGHLWSDGDDDGEFADD